MRQRPVAPLLAILLAASAWATAAAAASGLVAGLETLAARHSAEAEYHLGMLYNNGIEVPKDPRKALSHFTAAANGGDPLGAFKVGCYYAGQFGVVARDDALALKYKLLAAQAGYSLAQDDVANHYLAAQDYRHALPWLEAAAHQGDSHALYNLSALYNDGLGVPKSPGRAAAFFRLSHLAANGRVSAGAQKSLDEMARQMSPDERALAEQIAKAWVTQPTPLTMRALAGLTRAEALVQGP
jgi:TPR repeat protein